MSYESSRYFYIKQYEYFKSLNMHKMKILIQIIKRKKSIKKKHFYRIKMYAFFTNIELSLGI